MNDVSSADLTEPQVPVDPERVAAALALVDDAQEQMHKRLPRWDTDSLARTPSTVLFTALAAQAGTKGRIPQATTLFVAYIALVIVGLAALTIPEWRGRYRDIRGRAGRPRDGHADYSGALLTLVIYVASIVTGFLTGWWWLGLPAVAFTIAGLLLINRRWHAAFNAIPADITERATATLATATPTRPLQAADEIRMLAALAVINRARLPALASALRIQPDSAAATGNRLIAAGWLYADVREHKRGRWMNATKQGKHALHDHLQPSKSTRHRTTKG